MNTWFALLLAAIVAVAPQYRPTTPQNHSTAYRSMQQKLDYLHSNGARAHPDPKPTELTEAESDAYFNEGGVRLPHGVTQVHLVAKPGTIDGRAKVDFEQIMQGHGGATNPLYGMFSGTHDVHAVAQAGGSNGVATIKIQSVDLDGVEVPEFALELFVQHYLTPKFPNVGMTSTFKLPLRIQSATVEAGRVILIQR